MERLVGKKAIAAHLGLATEDTVDAWGALAVDPLPLRDWMGSVCAWVEYATEWQERRADLASWRKMISEWRARRPAEPSDRWLEAPPPPEPMLPIWVGWEQIVDAFPADRSVDTAQRAAELHHRPLPVLGHMLPGDRLTRAGGPPRVWIYRSAHRDWIDWRDRPHMTGQTRPRVASTAQLSLF